MLRTRPSNRLSATTTAPARWGRCNVILLTPGDKRKRGNLKRGGVCLAGANPHGVVEPDDENLAVADLAGLCRVGDGLDGLVDLIGCDRDLDLDFRQEADG